jgi:pyridoxine/pyridoxamine 5'-phosphate oxidase
MRHPGENPLSRLRQWIEEERTHGVPFPNGAVLGTLGLDGVPRTRMLGTYLCEDGTPKFYTSPSTKKVAEIEGHRPASLTFGFQRSLRSITIEGSLRELNETELDAGWRHFDADFRKHYLIFGPSSGSPIECLNPLRTARDALAPGAEEQRPESFIGFSFGEINRVVFYTVRAQDFAECEAYLPQGDGSWIRELRVP